MQIALDTIDFPEHQVRRRYDKAAIARMAQSLDTAGQQQPIIVIANGARNVCVDGRHRVEAARSLGWAEVWGEKAPGFTAAAELIAATVSNAVRMPLDPLDEWRMVVDLQADGRSLAEAAAALGITDRRARQLDRLGRLDSSVIKLIEESGELPAWGHLGRIASAPQDVQRKAATHKDAVWTYVQDGVEQRRPQWHEISARCTKRGERISRSVAIFNVETAGVVFEQDIFAQPGGTDEWTTADVAGFLAAQRTALEEEVAARAKKKQTAVIVEYNATSGGMKLPPRTYDAVGQGNPDKPKKGEIVLICMHPSGAIHRSTAIDAKAARAAATTRQQEAEKTARAKPKAGATPQPAEAAPEPDAAEPDDEPAPPPPVADISPVTKAGRDVIALAKTAALRKTLRTPIELPTPVPFRDLCAMLILTLHAKNVEVKGYRAGYQVAGDDVVAQLVDPSGHLSLPDDATLAGLAREVLARCLLFGLPSNPGAYNNPDSGAVAEWIGAALRAGDALERFDAEPFLKFVNKAELQPLAIALGIKPSETGGTLRREIAGKAPAWRPPGATFGAAGPKPIEKPATVREDAA